MRVKIATELFKRLLERVIKIVPSRSTFPILQNVYLSCDKENFSIYSTDLDFWCYVEKKLGDSIKEKGEAVVFGRKLLESLREISEPLLELFVEENTLSLKTSKGKFQFLTAPPEDFPKREELPKENSFSFNNYLLIEMFEKTGFCVAKETTRPALTGVLLETRDNELRFVGTDGYRLSLYKKRIEEKLNKNIALIIPPTAFELLLEDVKDVRIYFDESRIGFEYDLEGEKYLFISRLIEGPYPDYEKAIPTVKENYFTFDVKEFLKSLKLVSIFARAEDKTKMVILDLKEERIKLFTESAEVGKGEEEIRGKYVGEGMEIAFNAVYLQEILNHIDSDKATIYFTSPTSAMKIVPEEKKEGEEILYLLMPMHYER
ncbi:MAG: DNA polymerase III subunit beta [candidate division WOR-3 bacterium]|nr:DNA polymerase III subunit beta [candidate division WOR-3 bacterium]MCX7836679.1 DNA polymerase III subunit beta [candidate division WOR-3 bacterium]MDW8113680.1 DNA polymerase III subunit beta [candidate division WOR-3 bacterium]